MTKDQLLWELAALKVRMNAGLIEDVKTMLNTLPIPKDKLKKAKEELEEALTG